MAVNCGNEKKNNDHCNCTYPGCSRHGLCCECLRYHLAMNELPACCFPDDVEKTYDRSFRKFIEVHSR